MRFRAQNTVGKSVRGMPASHGASAHLLAASLDEAGTHVMSRWRLLCASMHVEQRIADKWGDAIRARYLEPCRRYHTLSHLSEMLGYFDEFKDRLQRGDLVQLAIFFHDLVYNGVPRQDERQSADEYRRFATDAGQPDDDAGLVYRWIVATADHKVSPEDTTDCRFFMDFDMAILGTPWPQYERYFRAVKKEYQLLKRKNALVWEVLWCIGRPRAMAGFLQVEHIYATPEFRERMEVIAFENLAREMHLWARRRNYMLGVAVACCLGGLAGLAAGTWGLLLG